MKRFLFTEFTRHRSAVAFVLAIVLCGPSSLVIANDMPPPGGVASDQTVARAVVTYPQPPADLEPLSRHPIRSLSNTDRPRPDPRSAPDAYARWQKLVWCHAPQIRC